MHKPPVAADPRSRSETSQSEIVAAVDLGSNSFHLLIARVHGEDVAMLDREREQVQLARGLGKRKQLGKQARQRAISATVASTSQKGVAITGMKRRGRPSIRFQRNSASWWIDEESRPRV